MKGGEVGYKSQKYCTENKSYRVCSSTSQRHSRVGCPDDPMVMVMVLTGV